MSTITQHSQSSPVVIFAGGGTGGHIYPNLAVVERLQEDGVQFTPHFVISERELDAQILQREGIQYTISPTEPLSHNPAKIAGFLASWKKGVGQIDHIFDDLSPIAVVSSGGFVSGPAVVGAEKHNIPVALVNLDAVPGKANRRLASQANQIFTVYPHESIPDAVTIGLPLRFNAVKLRRVCPPDDARRQLGLDPFRKTLTVVGGSQGAESVNKMLVSVLERQHILEALSGWQILHICGPHKQETASALVDQPLGDINYKCMEFCDQIGLVWRSSTVAISRSGAGSVAEVWANQIPTIFMPYPHHKDQHQRLNAEPLAQIGGCVLVDDKVEADENAQLVADPLWQLVRNVTLRDAMVKAMRDHKQIDGAMAVAHWLKAHLMPMAT